MELEESRAEARRLMLEAGWTPIPKPRTWNHDYTVGTLVGGVTPDGMTQYVKDWAAVRPGDPQYGPDTPDEPHEAATWLIARHKPVNWLTTEITLEALLAPVSEEGENLQDESNGETGEEASARVGDLDGDGEAGGVLSEEPSVELGPALVKGGSEFEAPEDAAIYADFTIEDLGGPDETLELPAPDPEDFAPEEFPPEEDPAPGVAIFGPPADHLEALRSQRMGDTMRYANMLMPPWTPDDNARLAYLRNFAMGVSEGRWENNSTMQSELESCESTLSRVNDIKEARDTKVAFLEGADRAGVEGFVVEADWP